MTTMNISANELRVGNWVIIDSEYAQLDEDAMEVLFGARNFSDCWPIVLTPELLKKIGFEFDTVTYYRGPLMCSEDLTFWYRCLGDKHRILIEIKYLHHLQNLFFALTQTELPIDNLVNS